MRRFALTLAAALCAPAGAAQDAAQQSTTLPRSRELAAQLADAERYLAEGRVETALALWQEVAESDPALMIATGDPDLFRGAVHVALERLAALSTEQRALRERRFGSRAEAELAAALAPPDLPRLEEIARRYVGIEAGERARRIAAEMWWDRGQPESALRLDPRGAARGMSDAGLPVAELVAAQRLPAVHGADDPALPLLDASRLAPLWDYRFEHDIPGILVRHRLAIGGGALFATDGYEVAAFEAGSGHLLWRRPPDPLWNRLAAAGLPSVERLREALSAHVLTAPVLAEGILLAVLHEPVALGRHDTYSSIAIRHYLPARRLVAFDARTGAVLWRMRTSWDAGATDPYGIAAGPPAVAGGRVYLPVFDAIGTIDLSLLALDLRTGEPLWQRFLASGQLETNLFGNVLLELATPPPLADAERVLVCSHLGSFHALDATTGAVQWSRTYRRMEVRPTETGQVARRPQWLARSLGAADGTRVAWAPADGHAIYLLATDGGAVIATWPALDAESRHVGTLLGLGPEGVWAAGSRVACLKPGSGSFWSAPLLEEGGPLSLPRGGALVRGEVLMPSRYASVERFGLAALEYRGRALDFFQDSYSSGAIQASSGLLFVEQPHGFSVFGSHKAIAATLAAPDLDRATLEALLPVAASLDFSSDPDTAQRLLDAALRLTARPDLREHAGRLHLIAARSALAVPDLDRAEGLLLGLLGAAEPGLAATAASLLLDDPLLLEPLRPGVARALQWCEQHAVEEIRLLNGELVRVPVLAARARALRARAGDRSLALRRALTEVLLLEPDHGLTVDGQPLADWGAASLQLLLESPEERAAYQRDGASALAERGFGPPVLRAFGRCDAVQDALAAEVARADLAPADRLLRARWRREFGDPQREWQDLAHWFPPAQPPPSAPASLKAGGRRARVAGAPLLVRQDGKGGAIAWIQASGMIQMIAFDGAGARDRQAFAVQGRLINQQDPVIATPEGCAVVLRDRVLHLTEAGRADEWLLPAPLRLGNSVIPVGRGLFACMLEAAPGFQRVAVLEASTGGTYLIEDLPGSAENRCLLLREDRWLFLVQENSPLAYRLDLHFRSAPLAFSLPVICENPDLHTMTLSRGALHYLADRTAPVSGWMVRAGPGITPLRLEFDRQDLKKIRARPGLAWIALPEERFTQPAAAKIVSWLRPGAEQPDRIVLDSPEARILELVDREYPPRPDFSAEEILVLLPTAEGGTRVSAFRAGSAGSVWNADLPEVPFRKLQSNQPQPRRAADAWAVALLLNATERASGSSLQLFLIEHDGRRRAHAEMELGGNGADQVRLDLVPGAILLRNGGAVTLFGDFR
jgi:outer membrane protein assembly factor BamB